MVFIPRVDLTSFIIDVDSEYNFNDFFRDFVAMFALIVVTYLFRVLF